MFKSKCKSELEQLQEELIVLQIQNSILNESAKKCEEIKIKSEFFFSEVMKMVEETSIDCRVNVIKKLRSKFLQTMFVENLRYKYFLTEKSNDYPNKGTLFHFIRRNSELVEIDKVIPIFFEKDVIITWPWDSSRLTRIVGKIEREGFNMDYQNHYQIAYVEELGFFITDSGNHSLTAAGVLENGLCMANGIYKSNIQDYKYDRDYLNYKICLHNEEHEIYCNNIYEVIVFELSVKLLELDANSRSERQMYKVPKNAIPISGRDLQIILEFIRKIIINRKLYLNKEENGLIYQYKELGVSLSSNLSQDYFVNEISVESVYVEVSNYYCIENLFQIIETLKKYHYQDKTNLYLFVEDNSFTIESIKVS